MRRVGILLAGGAVAASLIAATMMVGNDLQETSCSRECWPSFTRVTDDPLTTDRASTGGVTWADFDGDGDDDVFVANGYDVSADPPAPQMNQLYENTGGRFRPLPTSLSDDGSFSSGSAWADFDNDGRLDLFIPNQRGQDNLLYRNLGSGQFEPIQASPAVDAAGASYSATWADVDRDGWVDLFVSNGGLSGAHHNFLYRNVGGRLQPVEAGPVTSDSIQSGGATWVDHDLDGDVDLFVPGQAVRLYRNDGDWQFTAVDDVPFVSEPPLLYASWGGAWGDYDNDGDFDLYSTYSLGEQNRLYRNNGAGAFERIDSGIAVLDGSYAVHAVWADVDANGFLDLLVANWGSPVQVYLGSGNGEFERAVLGELGLATSFSSSLAVADMEGDGDLDVLVGHWPNTRGEGEENLLYRNDGPTGNWLKLQLRGTKSNAAAIGTRVEALVEINGRLTTLTREVRSQDGWRSQNSLTVHFGLGDGALVEEIRVYWPTGQEQLLLDVAANQTVQLVEDTLTARSGH